MKNLGDEVINKVIKIEKLKAEVVACEVMLEEDKFDSEDLEGEVRLSRVVNQGKIEVLKKELEPVIKKYLQ